MGSFHYILFNTHSTLYIMQQPFREKLSLQKRKELSAKITATHTSRVPIIVERSQDSPNLPLLDKKKFLAPQHYTMANFVAEIMNHLPSHEQSSLSFYVGNGTRAMPAMLIQQVYDQYKDIDGFLYVTYGEHKAFGGF